MIRAAIIGLGRWGQNLVNSVHGRSDAIRFVAGAIRNVASAEAYAREKEFPLHDSYEKPLALTAKSAAAALRACAKAGVTLAVGYTWRFQPALQEIRRMLEDGRLG